MLLSGCVAAGGGRENTSEVEEGTNRAPLAAVSVRGRSASTKSRNVSAVRAHQPGRVFLPAVRGVRVKALHAELDRAASPGSRPELAALTHLRLLVGLRVPQPDAGGLLGARDAASQVAFCDGRERRRIGDHASRGSRDEDEHTCTE